MIELEEKYLNIKKVRVKKTYKKVEKPTYKCFCCKGKFTSQKRFSKKGKKYRNYCKNCRKICYICLCRHGRQGDTCSDYCKKKYKWMRKTWKKLNPNKDIKYLEKALEKFDLTKIEDECLSYVYIVYNKEFANELRKNAQVIREKILKLQDIVKLRNDNLLLCFGRNRFIIKVLFIIETPSVIHKPIEDVESWQDYLE